MVSGRQSAAVAAEDGTAGEDEGRREVLLIAEEVILSAPGPLSPDEFAARLPHGSDIASLLRELQEAYAGRETPAEPVQAPEERRQALRMTEALLFASAEPLSADDLGTRLPEGSDTAALLAELQELYAPRGVNLVQVAGKWQFRTAGDLSFLLAREAVEQKRLSRAALETMAIIAYHQPVTRAEIEEIRGVATSKGTLDMLLETGWVRMRGRRKAPGRPVTYGTTEAFLAHFGLDSVGDLPGVEELKGAGLLDSRVPADFAVPQPYDGDALTETEDPLEDEVPAEAEIPAEAAE